MDSNNNEEEKNLLLDSNAENSSSAMNINKTEVSSGFLQVPHKTPFENVGPVYVNCSNFKRDALERKHIAAYAVGHLSNDLCAAAWFTYVLYYIKYVVNLNQFYAGYAMLSGQVADGITTPLVGFASDKIQTRIGSRQPWYLIGTLIVMPSFLCIFIYPDFETNSPYQIAYYVILPAIFNVGWAFVQISNMAIVNSITYST